MWNSGFGSLAPNSQIVQSDEEYLQPFKGGVSSAMNRQAQLPYQQSLMGQELSNAMSAWMAPADQNNGMGSWLYSKIMDGPSSDLADLENNFVKATGYTGPRLGDIRGFDMAGAQSDAASNVADNSVALQKAQEDRAAASQRQTDAYGQMQGGNYFGGMANEGYSAPTTNVGGLGGLGGMPATDPNPFAAYNATWQPEATQKRAGSWGSPFGGW